MKTLRILLRIAAPHRWPLQQLEIKSAFLHGDLNDTVYMELPEGFQSSSSAQDKAPSTLELSQ